MTRLPCWEGDDSTSTHSVRVRSKRLRTPTELCKDSTGAIRSSRKYSTLSGKVVVAGSVTMGTTSVPMRTPCKVLAMRMSCLSVGCASPCATAGNSANNGSPANNMNFLYITNCNKMK